MATVSKEPARPVASERLEDVVIRFAGDSRRRHAADRQPVHQRPRRWSATTSRRCPTSRPRSAPPPARCRASRASRSTSPSYDIHTPGDAPDVLVAMNPAALKTNLGISSRNGVIIVNTDEFTERNLEKAGYETNPLEDGTLKGYRVFQVAISRRSPARTLEGSGPRRQGRWTAARTSSPSAWSTGCSARPLEPTLEWIEKKFGKQPRARRGQRRRSRRATTTARPPSSSRCATRCADGGARARASTATSHGNEALALGLVAARRKLSGLPLFLGAYPITPAERHPARARAATRTSASPPSRPRTRSPPSAPPSARPSAARWR